MRFTTAGFTVLTTRYQVQLVVHEFTSHYNELLNTYAARGQFPVNGQFDVRVTGLDRPADTGLPGAQAPLPSRAGTRPYGWTSRPCRAPDLDHCSTEAPPPGTTIRSSARNCPTRPSATRCGRQPPETWTSSLA
ncbi:cholesterol oxidase substrate-binding domain-containing protein [Streptomyces sp. NPDC048106]|uniref:cholesterol oxidase substrate-binding domain-containing protein n=1 Tax=Streptomyces sp. NPDC048106 TaxID=3155750 RepID=UPI0034533B56